MAAWLAPVLGILGSLFKGKKTQYAPQMTPEQQKYYTQLLGMLSQNAGGNTQANQNYNYLYGNLGSMFYPGFQPPQQQQKKPGSAYQSWQRGGGGRGPSAR